MSFNVYICGPLELSARRKLGEGSLLEYFLLISFPFCVRRSSRAVLDTPKPWVVYQGKVGLTGLVKIRGNLGCSTFVSQDTS